MSTLASDVSSGETFEGMFAGATSFNVDIGKWDVSSGTNFYGMFAGATSFNANISKWIVSNGTDFRAMFLGAQNFSADISEWDVRKGTSFERMFSGATKLRSEEGGCKYYRMVKTLDAKNSKFCVEDPVAITEILDTDTIAAFKETDIDATQPNSQDLGRGADF